MSNKALPKLPLSALRSHRPEELITFRVSVLSQLLSRVVGEAVGRDLKLTSRQWRVLVMLNRLGASTSGQVANATRLDHSQVSRASYELAELGLIAMSNDHDDRRRMMLQLTTDGIEVLRRGIRGSQERQDQLRSCLSKPEYQAFGQALTVLTEQAQQMLDDLKSTTVDKTNRR